MRRRLRHIAVTWIVFQVAWFGALVPQDCCAAHRPGAHQDAAAIGCPMHESRADDGAHAHHGPNEHAHLAATHGAHHEYQPSPASPETECALRGICDGPMGALVALLAVQGVMHQAVSTVPVPDVQIVRPLLPHAVSGTFQPPDAPPPRA